MGQSSVNRVDACVSYAKFNYLPLPGNNEAETIERFCTEMLEHAQKAPAGSGTAAILEADKVYRDLGGK